MRVLVVDDDADIAAVISRIVKHLGHDAVTCVDPVEAIGRAGEDFAVVIADYHMPVTGIAVLMAFQAASPDCYRVLLTAAIIGPAIRKAQASGVVHCVLQKPVTIAELNGLLNDVER